METFDFGSLFELELRNTIDVKKFATERYVFDVKIAPLPCVFTGQQTIQIMPKVFEALFNKVMENWDENDRVTLEMTSRDMSISVFLNVRRLGDFSVDELMQKLSLVNSQQKFTLDEHFSMRVNRIVMPSGGKSNRRTHTHDLDDRIKSSKSVVKVTVGGNLCLPAGMSVLGAFTPHGGHQRGW